MDLTLATVVLLVLHRLDGRELYVNPDQITSIAEPRAGDPTLNRLTKCVIFTTDGKHYGILDSCAEVKRLLESR